jgi:hypothetical protein
MDTQEAQQIMQWAENEALVEWQVARLATSCNEVANTAQSPAVRREALRLKAAYGTSSYAVLSGRNPLVQMLDLVAMAELSALVWAEEGRAVSTFGAKSSPVEMALLEIRERVRAHALAQMSVDELREVGEMVRAWRKAHPGPVVVEFIRFEAFADEIAGSMGKPADLGGLLGRISGGARNVELLGERALFLTSRMPRLAEWHAEAAAANLLAQQELAEAVGAMKQLGELPRAVPEHLKALQMLDSRLAAMPAELAGAVAKQPVLKETLAEVEQAGQQIKALEGSVTALEKSITTLGNHLPPLAAAVHPDALRQLADHTGGVASVQVRSMILLAVACAAALLVLHALLRRWSHKPQLRE